jgi:hypothetical protein
MEKQQVNPAPEIGCEHRFTVLEGLVTQLITNDLPHIHAELRNARVGLDKLFYTLLGIGGAMVLGLLLHHLLGV